ncbi:ABC transporter permease subunit [Pikeienuella piscinae]|uniref:ABC transporter permease subunit n=1 Tax=Pikeienuella piscinae TaxID=2748098 RepID=A0A7L5BUI5_9RHOB|nr:ABC transporter permease subunit [Pikeienuella piscinae]QIE55930.1 ABC transporter permease subunit [Pikeienuella piscinae]
MSEIDRGGRSGARLLTPIPRFVARARRSDILAQTLFIIILLIVGWVAVDAVSTNLERLSVKSGYGFLFEDANFELGESVIPFRAGDSYFRAFAAGLANTLKVAAIGIVLSTIVGLVIALGQLSPSVVIATACRLYIDAVRNVPLLLQLIFWHTILTSSLPTVRKALSPFEGVYLTNRGLYLPAPVADPAHGPIGLAALVGVALAGAAWFFLRRKGVAMAAFALPVVVTFFVYGAPVELQKPELAGFNFRGGIELSPEFAAMLLGLTIYVGAFNAEIIRAGILGVDKGQREAGAALGLSSWRVMRKIILPQALRIILPSMTNSYLNLTKESSLAVAIGYPEIVRVSNIAVFETGQAIECISIVMIIYLVLSLITSLILNWLNARARLVER